MQNSTNKSSLPYWRLKTFNDKLNATISLLKESWKPLFKANLLIGGPLFVIGIGMILFYFNIFFQHIKTNSDDPNIALIVGFVLTVIVGALLYGLSILAITMVTFEFIKVKFEHPDKVNDLNFIFNGTKKRFGKMFGFMLLGVAANTIANSIVQLVSFILIFLGPIGIFIIFPLYAMAQFLVYSYMYVMAPTAYYEKISFSRTLSKGIDLMKDRFWQTTGLYLGTRAIQYIIVSGFILPIVISLFYYFLFNQTEGRAINLYSDETQRLLLYLGMFLSFIFLFFSLFSNIFHIISGAVQYFSLKEEKENNHIYSQIEHFETL